MFSLDSDAAAMGTHAANFACEGVAGDIEEFLSSGAPVPQADVVIGGPPCQGVRVHTSWGGSKRGGLRRAADAKEDLHHRRQIRPLPARHTPAGADARGTLAHGKRGDRRSAGSGGNGEPRRGAAPRPSLWKEPDEEEQAEIRGRASRRKPLRSAEERTGTAP